MTDQQTFLSTQDTVDLTNCDREPIHLLGGVQGYGCLIATSSDFMINHVSANVERLMRIAPTEAIGTRLVDLLPGPTIHDLRTKLQMLNVETSASRLFAYDVLGDGTLFDVSIHALDNNYIFEFEPKTDTKNRDEMNLVQPLVSRVRRTNTVQEACQQAAMAIRVLSGFDRVMVYQFDEDGTGEVIAEKKQPHMDALLGLRYPASDIPKQARALYLRSTLRLIADVDGEVSAIIPQTNVHGAPMDLSLSVTRAVSPIHLEYLRNMGVASSMSVSIIKNGKLWGLFACHHETPHHVDFERRTAIELFAQFFSYELIQRIDIEARSQSQDTRRIQENLMIQLSAGTSLTDGFDMIADELSDLVTNDGIAIYSDGRYVSRGEAPTEMEFKKFVRFLNTAPTGRVFSTHNLVGLYPDADVFSSDVAGVLAIPISRTPRDYILFFRREVAKSVKWAGNPNKPVEVGVNGTRLTPRKSFEAWSEMVRQTSTPWTENECFTAETLRVSLIEIVLKLTDDANEARRKAADTQELLIAELNHRVRNILNLIQGLVSQSRTGVTSVASYTQVLDGRVQALARAHDQLTQQDWAPSSLRKLITVEIAAFASNSERRVTMTGDAPMLMPGAFSTVALVIHEMVTNAAKYGALTDQSGTVSIDLRIQDDGALLIKWREIGGPPVRAPTRQGFGTTIIEKTIPFELSGTVETRYLITGFEADIMIPSVSISEDQDDVTIQATTSVDSDEDGQSKLSGNVLVLEDNMVIALDASDILTDNGADHVFMSSSVEDAGKIIENNTLTFALLDVNLGDQTSLPIAQKLAALKIPYVVATGYGDADSIISRYPPSIIVPKPFTAERIAKAISKSLSSQQ